jgi:hypothetical protein
VALPWVRLDSNIASHDKILALLAQRDGAKAFVLYICGLGYAGGHGTDGCIPKYALPVLHGNDKLARQLVDTRLWEYGEDGSYRIRNFDLRQELAVITEGKRAAQSMGGRKAMCQRWHGPDCGCWRKTAGIEVLGGYR